MNRTIAVAFCLAAVGALSPPASTKAVPLEPPDPSRGTIGITIKVIPPAKMGLNPANGVFFVRVNEDADRFSAESLIPSTYTKGGNVYLLNAKPGRYVAVGCTFNAAAGLGFAGSTDDGAVVFSQPDIVKTEVEVRAGSVVFMGAIEVLSSTKTQNADGAQSHYLRMMAPSGASQSFMARVMSGNLVYIAAFEEIDRGPTAEAELWDDAVRRDFKNDAAWKSRIANRSAAPSGGAAAATGASVSIDAFVSALCVTVNTAKAQATGSPKEADSIARMACQTVMTDWGSQGCPANLDQDPCKKRLRSLDGSLRNSGSSMLYAAAQAGQTSICSTMIASGSDVNAALSTGWTPLMIAAAANRTETVKLLLEKGADPDAKNAEGKTAAAIAAEKPYPEVVALLAKAPAAPDPVKQLEAEIEAGLTKLREDCLYFAKLEKEAAAQDQRSAACQGEPSPGLVATPEPGETQERTIERLTRSRDALVFAINDNARAGAEKYGVPPLPLVTAEMLRAVGSTKEGP